MLGALSTSLNIDQGAALGFGKDITPPLHSYGHNCIPFTLETRVIVTCRCFSFRSGIMLAALRDVKLKGLEKSLSLKNNLKILNR